MRIPKRFKLAGRTWTVKMKPLKEDYGTTSMSDFVIELSTKTNKTHECLVHTFCHELMHAIAGTAGMAALYGDEMQIDALSNLLAQALETAEYDE